MTCVYLFSFMKKRTLKITYMFKNKITGILLMLVPVASCQKDAAVSPSLKAFTEEHQHLVLTPGLIACSAGIPTGWMGETEHPTSVFFYPVEGAFDFRYFETNTLVKDSTDYALYREKVLEDVPVFNGKLRRFKNTAFEGERWGIMTYQTEDRLHICDPIRLKTNAKPTQVAPALLHITENGTTPYFEWEDGWVDENVIYFQVVTDTLGNVISGTYTYDKHWNFYHLDNVVLNIHDVTPAPSLQPHTTYTFTLMGVSDDNWVNLMAQKTFRTQ